MRPPSLSVLSIPSGRFQMSFQDFQSMPEELGRLLRSVALGPIDGLSVAADDGGVTHSSAVPGSAFAGFRIPPDVILLAVRW